jgi:hypothetical protein
MATTGTTMWITGRRKQIATRVGINDFSRIGFAGERIPDGRADDCITP